MQLLCKVIKDISLVEDNEQVIRHRKEFILQHNQEADCNVIEQEASDEEKARQLSEEILQEAYNKAKLIEEQAYQKGYEVGLQRGQAEGQAICERASLDACQILNDLELFRTQTLKDLQEDLKKLAIEMAEKIIIREIDLGHDVTTKIVEGALQGVLNLKRVNIFVNSVDLQLIESMKDGLQRKLGIASMEIFVDPLITYGGCKIQTEKGWIDARIENQLVELEKALEEISS